MQAITDFHAETWVIRDTAKRKRALRWASKKAGKNRRRDQQEGSSK